LASSRRILHEGCRRCPITTVVQNSARANNRRDDILKGDPDCWPAGDRDKTASPASP